jgi:hypothetical protein
VAVRIDPTNEDVWLLLGDVKEAIAKEMLNTAEELVGRYFTLVKSNFLT